VLDTCPELLVALPEMDMRAVNGWVSAAAKAGVRSPLYVKALDMLRMDLKLRGVRLVWLRPLKYHLQETGTAWGLWLYPFETHAKKGTA
jgi:hypothetical protein